MEQLIQWAIDHVWEIIGTVSGLIYLYLEVKEVVWLWPVGIITSGMYVVVFYDSKFYADMVLSIYYVIISIYGWYMWLYGNSNSKVDKELAPLRISVTPSHLWKYLFGAFLAMFLLMVWVLKSFTDSPVPIGDAFVTALSIVATWMLARKYIEMWWLWVLVNAVSLCLFVWKGLYPTSILFLFYTSMAVVGYYHWKRRMNRVVQNTVV